MPLNVRYAFGNILPAMPTLNRYPDHDHFSLDWCSCKSICAICGLEGNIFFTPEQGQLLKLVQRAHLGRLSVT